MWLRKSPSCRLLEAGPEYIRFAEVKLHIVLFSHAFVGIRSKILWEAEYKAELLSDPAAQAHVPHRDTAPEETFTPVPAPSAMGKLSFTDLPNFWGLLAGYTCIASIIIPICMFKSCFHTKIHISKLFQAFLFTCFITRLISKLRKMWFSSEDW